MATSGSVSSAGEHKGEFFAYDCPETPRQKNKETSIHLVRVAEPWSYDVNQWSTITGDLDLDSMAFRSFPPHGWQKQLVESPSCRLYRETEGIDIGEEAYAAVGEDGRTSCDG